MFFCLPGKAGKGKCRVYFSDGPAAGILPLILAAGQKQLGGGLISTTHLWLTRNREGSGKLDICVQL